MKALIRDEIIIQISHEEFPVHPDYIWIDCPDNCSTDWTYSNNVLSAPVIAVPTKEEVLKQYEDAIQVVLDNKAREKMYDNALSIASYANSTNTSWKAESLAFIAWRDAVYVYAMGILTQVQNGGSQPAISDFITGLPVMTWPS